MMAASKSNRLIQETSPYLLQHAHNPVDWYPWGEEAIGRAVTEGKPIFLSVGYSACHWCHVMERESFEDEGIARLMSKEFVCIKVDREERPDIDQIYMAAVQAMTGQGGWPMSVFLTPQRKPFYGGTYFPPHDRGGMPGFDRVLRAVAEAWHGRRAAIEESAGNMTRQLQGLGGMPSEGGVSALDFAVLDRAYESLQDAFEPVYGGFGRAPKFPHAMDLRLLLRQYRRTGEKQALHMVCRTLDQMARGGIYDHLGGGFARYSTDNRWLVPHFEKMLYDNALLATAYLEAYRATGEDSYAEVARETLDYVLRDMTSEEGVFYSAEDADSEGEEGRFYVWSWEEVTEAIGEERGRTFAKVYGVTKGGNWEGRNILYFPAPPEDVARELRVDARELSRTLGEDRARLLDVRKRRVAPGKDTKALTSWNGLMLAALAEGGLVLEQPEYIEAAERGARFLLEEVVQPDGRLWHCWKDGRARFNGYLDDYAYLIDGLARLFEVTGKASWIAGAIRLADVMIEQFHDPDRGGFFYTGKDHESLIVRQKDLLDNATPSGNAMAITGLARLGRLTGRARYEGIALSTLEAIAPVLSQYPTAVGQSLIAADFLLADSRELVIRGGWDPDGLRTVLRSVGKRFLPNAVIVVKEGEIESGLAEMVPLLVERGGRGGKVTTYVCRNRACQEPLVGPEGINEALGLLE